jgi:glycosyltransferase involved in cell wall biosynthesis
VITRAVPGYPISDEEFQGVQIHRWIKTWDRGPAFALSFVIGIVRALRRLRGEMDVVHTHQALWEAVATGLARPSLRGVPTLVQPASSGHYGEAQELGRTRGAAMLRRIILRNTQFAAISDDLAREWTELGVPPARLSRLCSGVDTDVFHPGASLVDAELLPRPRVVFTGRMHPQKNLPMLLGAWVEVARRSSANLILIGPGSDRQALADQAATLGVADRVQFVGAVPNPADYLRAADVFVLPSVAEGMSNSLLEAMASALPCVVSGVGGNTDLITHGRTGLLVSDSTPGAWTTTLLDLIHDPGEALRLGQGARDRIETEYSLRAVVGRYVDLYRDLIARENQRSRC